MVANFFRFSGNNFGVVSSFRWLFCYIFSPAAGNESCPQPQTSEHLAAIEIMKLKHIIILQNKIDLIRDSQAKDQYQEILKFVQGELEFRVYVCVQVREYFLSSGHVNTEVG